MSIVVMMSLCGRDRLDYLKCAVDSTLADGGEHRLLLGVEDPLPTDTDEYSGSLARNLRVQIKRYPARFGFTPVLNDLIDVALSDPSCEYIFRMDPDDIWLKGRSQRQLEFFRDNPNVDVVGGQAILIDEEGRPYGKVAKVLTCAEMKRTFPVDSPLLHPTVAFRARLLRRGFRYPLNIVCEDLAFWKVLLEVGTEMGNVSEQLLEYRQTPATYVRRKGFAQGWPAMTVRLNYIWTVIPWRVDLALLVIMVTLAKAVVPARTLGWLYEVRTRLLS